MTYYRFEIGFLKSFQTLRHYSIKNKKVEVKGLYWKQVRKFWTYFRYVNKLKENIASSYGVIPWCCYHKTSLFFYGSNQKFCPTNFSTHTFTRKYKTNFFNSWDLEFPSNIKPSKHIISNYPSLIEHPFSYIHSKTILTQAKEWYNH